MKELRRLLKWMLVLASLALLTFFQLPDFSFNRVMAETTENDNGDFGDEHDHDHSDMVYEDLSQVEDSGEGGYLDDLFSASAKRRKKKSSGRSVSSAPIYRRFVSSFNSCARGCKMGRTGTWGKRGNRSCHPTGQALDLHSMVCGGKSYTPLTSKFYALVKCMRGKGWKVLHNYCVKGLPKNKTTCHKDHGHFSLGCTVRGRRVY